MLTHATLLPETKMYVMSSVENYLRINFVVKYKLKPWTLEIVYQFIFRVNYTFSGIIITSIDYIIQQLKLYPTDNSKNKLLSSTTNIFKLYHTKNLIEYTKISQTMYNLILLFIITIVSSWPERRYF